MENAPERAVFLCRTLDSSVPPAATMPSYHYAGVEAGVPLGLGMDPPFYGVFPLLGGALWYLCGLASQGAGALFRAAGLRTFCGCCCRTRIYASLWAIALAT